MNVPNPVMAVEKKSNMDIFRSSRGIPLVVRTVNNTKKATPPLLAPQQISDMIDCSKFEMVLLLLIPGGLAGVARD